MEAEHSMKKKNIHPARHSRKLRVLIIEDNADLAANIGDFLEDKGHIIDYALDGLSGLHLALTLPFDVIILDIILPGIDGMTLCRRFREDAEKSNPILMLTAKDTIEDKLEGFDAGADDYLVKPFVLEELEARLMALTRRPDHHKASKIFESGPIRLDIGQQKVTVNGNPVKMTPTCFCILEELMRRTPEVVTRNDLKARLWGDWEPASDSLRTHIYAIRKAVDTKGEMSCIETITGIGFRLIHK